MVDACVGIKDADDLLAMRIYPNPSDGDFVLSAPDSSTVEIYTLLGSRCKYHITKLDSGRWFISGLSCGTFLVKVIDPYGKGTVKRVVIN